MAPMTLNSATPSVLDSGQVALVDRDQCVTMSGIGWKKYRALLRLRGDGSRPRMIYLDGDLYIVSPSQPHERWNLCLGTFLSEVIIGLRIPCLRTGQTTFRRRGKRGGVEGDQTYYFANEPRVRGKSQIDLRIDPPPDLAVEVVYKNPADAALKVYRRLGVPEIWVYVEDRLAILLRQANGEYKESETSRAIPFLKAVEIFDQARQLEGMSELEWMEGVRRWVREVLVPRVQGQGG